MRARQDLTATRQLYQGRTYWVVKDPVALNYFRFQEEEYAILQMLDGSNSLDQIKRRFERQFPPQKITVEELSSQETKRRALAKANGRLHDQRPRLSF